MPTFMQIACGIHALTIKDTPLDLPEGAKLVIKDMIRSMDRCGMPKTKTG